MNIRTVLLASVFLVSSVASPGVALSGQVEGCGGNSIPVVRQDRWQCHFHYSGGPVVVDASVVGARFTAWCPYGCRLVGTYWIEVRLVVGVDVVARCRGIGGCIATADGVDAGFGTTAFCQSEITYSLDVPSISAYASHFACRSVAA